MRMWMFNPENMCHKHLLGEHVECHMLLGTVIKGKNFQGYINNNLFEPSSLKTRHDQLADDMIRRGYNHKSPLELPDNYKSYFSDEQWNFKINNTLSAVDLLKRCDKCSKGYIKEVIPEYKYPEDIYETTIAKLNIKIDILNKKVLPWRKDMHSAIYAIKNLFNIESYDETIKIAEVFLQYARKGTLDVIPEEVLNFIRKDI